MFRKIFGILIFVSAACGATVNQIEFMYGRGTPRSSVDFGDGSSAEGSQGPAWSAQFLHKIRPHVYLGVGGGEYRSSDNVSGTLVPQADSSISARMTSIFGLGRVDLSWNPKVVTYAIGGAGWGKHSLLITSVPTSPWSDTGTSEIRTIMDSSNQAFGYMAGMGLDYTLNDRLLIGAEARYQGVLRKEFQTTLEGEATTGRTSISVPLSLWWIGLKAGVKY